MNTKVIADAYAEFYENLTAEAPKEEYALFFDDSSEFQDPFQKVQGLNAIHTIFVNMYKTLENPRFQVEEVICSDDVAYLRWKFVYALSKNSKEESFTGVSRVVFTESAKVTSHIDYWDAAEHVYEKIPLLGSLLRFIKRKIHA
jgi:ketosteroid isomerase-like protein